VSQQTSSSKKKEDYQIFIIFGTNISDTAGYQSNDRSSFQLIQHLLLHYPGKAERAKYALKLTQNVNKFYLTGSVAPNSRSITRFDRHAAASLADDV